MEVQVWPDKSKMGTTTGRRRVHSNVRGKMCGQYVGEASVALTSSQIINEQKCTTARKMMLLTGTEEDTVLRKCIYLLIYSCE